MLIEKDDRDGDAGNGRCPNNLRIQTILAGGSCIRPGGACGKSGARKSILGDQALTEWLQANWLCRRQRFPCRRAGEWASAELRRVEWADAVFSALIQGLDIEISGIN